MARRNPFQPGTQSYVTFEHSRLNRSRALAEATAARAKNPEARRRAQQRASTVRRSLRAIESRQEFRASLSEHDRSVFDTLPIGEQERFRAVAQRYREFVPPSEPDPFAERPAYRGSLWRLFYSTRAGIRRREPR